MIYCTKCGKEMPEGTKYCPACGSAVGEPEYSAPAGGNYKQEETGAFAWGILSFFLTWITVIGGIVLCIILYASGKPKSGFAALMGMIAAILVGVIVVVVFVVILGAAANTDSLIGLF